MKSGGRFGTKDEARQAVWDRLQAARVARFPFPPHHRIPNFAGAAEAAARLLDHPHFARARRIKVNPDAPQRPLREEALARGIEVLVPAPRLRAGFARLDPRRIRPEDRRAASSLSRGARFARPVPLDRLPSIDAIVCGSVAVARDGRRCGKGHGYSDLEYGILRELGHPPVPVGTTVHPLQLVDALPWDSNDLPVAVIATPEEVMEVDRPPPAPGGIDWSRLSEDDLDAMPILRELAAATTPR